MKETLVLRGPTPKPFPSWFNPSKESSILICFDQLSTRKLVEKQKRLLVKLCKSLPAILANINTGRVFYLDDGRRVDNKLFNKMQLVFKPLPPGKHLL